MNKPWNVLLQKLKLSKGTSPGRLHVIKDPGDRIFSVIIGSASVFVILLLFAFILLLFYDSFESIKRFGFSFITGSNWNPVETEQSPISFGSLPFIFGTIVTSVVALILATPLALGSALFIVEYAPLWLGKIISFIIELLVAIPSVAYGIWGLFVLVPFMRSTVEPALQSILGPLPVLGALVEGSPIGQDLLTGSVILAIMILPTILSVSREIIENVPRLQKEGMLALGATKWEVLTGAVLPYARGGIVGGAMLGLARAIGETMAVTMVIGNSSTKIGPSLLTPGYTIASAIANQFTEADSDIYFSAIVELGLLLLVVASIFNILAHFLTQYILKGGDARHA